MNQLSIHPKKNGNESEPHKKRGEYQQIHKRNEMKTAFDTCVQCINKMEHHWTDGMTRSDCRKLSG